MDKTTEKTIEVDAVNFDKFSIQRREVAVNGKNLPLSIGDKIKFSATDKYNKTVMGISLYEDGRVSYVLEWYNPDSGQFENEAVTLSELKLLSRNNVKSIKKSIGLV